MVIYQTQLAAFNGGLTWNECREAIVEKLKNREIEGSLLSNVHFRKNDAIEINEFLVVELGMVPILSATDASGKLDKKRVAQSGCFHLPHSVVRTVSGNQYELLNTVNIHEAEWINDQLETDVENGKVVIGEGGHGTAIPASGVSP